MHSNGIITLIFTFAALVFGNPYGIDDFEHSERAIGCGTIAGNETAHLEGLGRRWNYQQATLPEAGSHIKVHWNIVMRDNSPEGGSLSDTEIHRQIEVLNRDFEPVGLSFEVAEIKRTYNARWFGLNNGQYSEEKQMKAEMPLQGVASLRIFSVDNPTRSSWAWKPSEYGPPPDDLDGVVLTRPAIIGQGWNRGHTLTHEVGHWAGLEHTFYGGCYGQGDSVTDTPPQARATWQCDTPVYSCGTSQPDANDNYMNYLHDYCRKRFTPGQIEFMRKVLKAARGITLGAGKINNGEVPKSTSRTATGNNAGNNPNRRPSSAGRVAGWRPGNTGGRPVTTGWKPVNPGRKPVNTDGGNSNRWPVSTGRRPAGTGRTSVNTAGPQTKSTSTSADLQEKARLKYTQAANQLRKLWDSLSNTFATDSQAGATYTQAATRVQKLWDSLHSQNLI